MRKTKTCTKWLVAVLCACYLCSCIKDTEKISYTVYTPIYKTTAEIGAQIKSATPQPISQTGKIYLIDHYLLMNELNKGVHILDITDPSNPRNVAFIDIPRNEDIAVTGNILYADCYTDLMAIDIHNPLQATLLSYVSNIFPDRRYVGGFTADSGKVIIDWSRKDTVMETTVHRDFFKGNFYYTLTSDMSFSSYLNTTASTGSGQGGSMARFAIAHPFLYTVTTTKLNVVNINQPQSPKWDNTVDLGFGIETIFPYNDKLFIGSNNGIQIFSISDPVAPSKVGQFAHATTCAPVIFDGQYAYVTLRGGTSCGGYDNQLDVLDASDPSHAALIKTYPLTNPFGLTKDGNALFICDGSAGLKYFDAADVNHITLINTISLPQPYVVIHSNKRLYVSAQDRLYIYDYSDLGNISLKSKILLTHN